MEYKVETIDIRELLRLNKNGKLNLHPDYQRNFIWSPKEQKMLSNCSVKPVIVV